MRTLKTFTLILLLAIVSFSYIEFSAAVSVGVKVGDWAKYNIIATWESEVPNATEPGYIRDFKNTEWKNVTAEKISGTNVTILVTTQFTNGTQKNTTSSGDIATGIGDEEFGFQIIPAGLSKGDIVPRLNSAINYTTFKEFAGANREVDYVSLSLAFDGETISEYYYDKQTGILCASLIFNSFKGTILIKEEITETNLWQAESPQTNNLTQTLIWALPITAALLFIGFLVTRGRHKSKIRRRRHLKT